MKIILAFLMVMAVSVSAWAKPQTLCPVMGDSAINNSLYVDHAGKRIYVCCKSCIEAVQKDPEKYIKQMEAEGIELAVADAKGHHCQKDCKKDCKMDCKNCDHKQCDQKNCKKEGGKKGCAKKHCLNK